MGSALLGWTDGPTVNVPPSAVLLEPFPAVKTDGRSGAAGFLRWDVTYSAEATVVHIVSTVAAVFRTKIRTSDSDRRLQERNAIEGRTQDLGRIGAKMSAENFLIHRTEVDRVLQVAGVVQRGQARLLAVQSALHRVADQEQRRGRAMVGATACVFLRPPAELGPRGDENLVRHVVRGQVRVEGGNGRVEVAHQVVVPVELGVVRVETAKRDVEQLD